MQKEIYEYFLELVNKIIKENEIKSEDLKNAILFNKKEDIDKNIKEITSLILNFINENTKVIENFSKTEDIKNMNKKFLYHFMNEHSRKIRKF